MALTLDVDPRIIQEQIALLRDGLATVDLTPRQQCLVVNLLTFFQEMAAAPEDRSPAAWPSSSNTFSRKAAVFEELRHG